MTVIGPVPFYTEERVALYLGDCVSVMAAMPEQSVDAVVTDPPYGLEFMGKEWDHLGGGRTSHPGIGERPTAWPNSRGWNDRRCSHCGHLSHGGSPCGCGKGLMVAADDRWAKMQMWHLAWAHQAFRVLKPGSHLLAFGGSRTHHRLACALEDAGFEIRDCLMWLYGSGFPKSLDVSKAMDKAAGAERNIVGKSRFSSANRIASSWQAADESPHGMVGNVEGERFITASATDAAKQWDGWGTALKPAWEPIILARKPLSEPTIAANVLKWGTGALNIDGCRIGQHNYSPEEWKAKGLARVTGNTYGKHKPSATSLPLGRWPANVVLSHTGRCELVETIWRCASGCPVRLLDEQSGALRARGNKTPTKRGKSISTSFLSDGESPTDFGDSGGASRFFYTAKADQEDRDGSRHPTVKPTDLMAWLVRLVTPPGGVVLDPFLGSGPTAWAAREYELQVVGIELDKTYLEDAVRRLRQQVLLL